MTSVLNLPRSYRGLVFRATISCGRQGHILEVMEHKRAVLLFIDSLSEATWGMEAKLGRTNVRVTVCLPW
jgi:hypothetical protein